MAEDTAETHQSSSAPDVSEEDRRENKERRRRERRERRARRQRQRQEDMMHQFDGYFYENGCHLPDILNSHVPPPPYTTLPGRGSNVATAAPEQSRRGTWRSALPSFSRRSQNQCDAEAGGHTLVTAGDVHHASESKSCCGVSVSQTVSIRWFIVMIAFVGICCAVVGTVLGAMKASGREHLTVSLLMIGVGIVLITVSGIAWRLTSQDGPSCRAMLGLGGHNDYGDGRFMSRPSYPRGVTNTHPYSGMMYTEFQYRPPPPSYAASMQEYRLRLLLMDRNGGPALPPPPPPVMSPPPAYRSTRSGLPVPHEVSRPPSYRSRASDLPVPVHGRHSSQLSYLSYAGAPMEPTLETEEPKEQHSHASVVSVIPCSGQHKASIRIPSDMDQYMSNIQDQFQHSTTINTTGDKSDKPGDKNSSTSSVNNVSGGGVTVVTGPSHHQFPVVVTVSGAVSSDQSGSCSDISTGKVDITAHL